MQYTVDIAIKIKIQKNSSKEWENYVNEKERICLYNMF